MLVKNVMSRRESVVQGVLFQISNVTVPLRKLQVAGHTCKKLFFFSAFSECCGQNMVP